MMKPHRDVKRSACKGVPASYLLSHGRPPQKSEGETAGNTCQLTVGFHHCVGEVFAPCLTSGWSQAISWGCGLIRRLNRGRRVHPRGVPLTWLSARGLSSLLRGPLHRASWVSSQHGCQPPPDQVIPERTRQQRVMPWKSHAVTSATGHTGQCALMWEETLQGQQSQEVRSRRPPWRLATVACEKIKMFLEAVRGRCPH